MHHGRQEIIGIRRAAGNCHHRLAEHLRNAGGTGRIRAGRGHAAPRRTGADGNNGTRVGGAFLEQFDRRLAADLAINAAILGRNRPFDDQNVFALVFLHRLMPGCFDLMAGGGEQGFVVVERDDVENQVFQRRMLGAQDRLGAAGAFLEMQPDHARPLFAGDRLGDCRISPLRQTERGCQRGTELEEFAPRHRQACSRRFDAGVGFQRNQILVGHE